MLRKNGYLQPVILQGLGVFLIVGFGIFWVLTGKESALFVGAGLTLIGVGSAGGAMITIRQDVSERAEEHKRKLLAHEENEYEEHHS